MTLKPALFVTSCETHTSHCCFWTLPLLLRMTLSWRCGGLCSTDPLRSSDHDSSRLKRYGSPASLRAIHNFHVCLCFSAVCPHCDLFYGHVACCCVLAVSSVTHQRCHGRCCWAEGSSACSTKTPALNTSHHLHSSLSEIVGDTQVRSAC